MSENNDYIDWVPLNKRTKLTYPRMMSIASGNII